MRNLKFLTLMAWFCILSSCNSGNHLNKKNYKLSVSYESKNLQSGDRVELSITSKFDFDSVQFSFADRRLGRIVPQDKLKTTLKEPLGEHPMKALVFYKGDTVSISKDVVLYAKERPVLYSYNITNSFPHDPQAFTQGLEFYKDTLYEGTGMYGVSELRKVDLKSGEVLKKITLDRKYFGEGISILNGKIYQLTWREDVGFIYDVRTFEKEKTFSYHHSKEGWGLCNDGQVFYKSDGTDKIWILDPDNLEEKYYINPVTNSSLASKVNELEWVDGKIYANTWQKDGVLIINPTSGAVEGVIDFRGLKSKQNNDKADVLNGIAYDAENDRLFVTGKYWDKIFEVEIVEK